MSDEEDVRYTLSLSKELMEKIDNFAKETERNRASAMRYLLKKGLECENK